MRRAVCPKKSTKIKFLGPETAGWGGGLPCEGVGVEKVVPSLESLFSLGFEGGSLACPGNFAGMSRTPGGVQKVCTTKFVRIFRSLVSTLLFQPQTVTRHKPHAPIEHLARGRLWVDSWSIFGQFRSKMPKPTENRLKTDPLQGPDRRLPLRRGEGLWLK